MRDELLTYYERELAFLRQMGAEFGEKYPKIASRLQLEADKCEDPHVERLIEAFAFLAARVHLRLDDDFPEITESLLNVLYPHYLAPIPSMSIAQFALDREQGKLTSGYHVPLETALYSRPIQGTPCRFRTCYPVTLWPIEVTSARLDSLDPVDTRGRWEEAVLKLDFKCFNDTKFSELKTSGEEGKAEKLDTLRFFLDGEPQITYGLYELLFNNSVRVEVSAPAQRRGGQRATIPQTVVLPPGSIRQVGFEQNEGVLPYTSRSFMGYRLLTEYFTFPEKFLFFDITNLAGAGRELKLGDEFTISIYLENVSPPRGIISAANFQLGCTPVVNLFRKVAEPIELSGLKHEYRVVPDVHRQGSTEVYSIDAVTSIESHTKQILDYRPFYSVKHSSTNRSEDSFWYASRRQSTRKDDVGTEVFLSFVNLSFKPQNPRAETVTIHTTCSNRDLPSRLPFGGREGDFEVDGAGSLTRVRCLRKPTNTIRPPFRRGAQWRLISHLSLNHLSLTEDERSSDPEALKEILTLYNFSDSQATNRQINGITALSAKRVVRQTGSRIGTGFARGLETTVEFDEEMYVGGGVFLFASIIERFLGLYVTVNSFNQLVAKTKQREGNLKRWQPRAGDQPLL